MNSEPAEGSIANATIRAARVELACKDLDQTVQFFTETLGMRIDAVFPADAPAIADLSGHGLALRLVRGGNAPAARLRIACERPKSPGTVTAPNGTQIEIVEHDPPLVLPPVKQSVVITRLNRVGEQRNANAWQTGRAGMLYRDLVPDRQGGRYIASHIRIPNGGPVPDYVHFHKIRFQMIYCYRGWVRLVYEDQGEPFVMNAGDCVLQPPQIRHRVLECGAGLEVIEIGCPANHETLADHELELPTRQLKPDREFGGQAFAFHQVKNAVWQDWRVSGFEARDFGFGVATQGIGNACVVRPAGVEAMSPASSVQRTATVQHTADFCLLFVLTGTMALVIGDQPVATLRAGDCCVVPAATDHSFTSGSADLTLLEVQA